MARPAPPARPSTIAPGAPATARAAPSAWRRADLEPASWLLSLPPACIVELDEVARRLADDGGPIERLAPGQFALAACADAVAEARRRLTAGIGFVVLDRVPVERYATAQNRAIGWLLANLMGRVVAQKQDGTRLYDVRDSGRRAGYGVRRSITNLAQEFHTDGGWLARTPAFVGLFCIAPAAEGGLSRCASLITVHDELHRHAPDLLERLHQPFWWDRQAEHAPDERPCSRHPVYWREGDEVLARYYDDYVRKGQALAGEALDPTGVKALEAMRAIIDAEASWLEFRLAPGQLQYVDNRRIAHARTAFRDGGEPGAGRHLMRFWNREDGALGLEG